MVKPSWNSSDDVAVTFWVSGSQWKLWIHNRKTFNFPNSSEFSLLSTHHVEVIGSVSMITRTTYNAHVINLHRKWAMRIFKPVDEVCSDGAKKWRCLSTHLIFDFLWNMIAIFLWKFFHSQNIQLVHWNYTWFGNKASDEDRVTSFAALFQSLFILTEILYANLEGFTW